MSTSPTINQEERLLTATDLVAYLGLSRATINNLLVSGRIPSIKKGRSRRVRRSDVESFLDEHLSPPGRVRP